jgi:hypothetical protein
MTYQDSVITDTMIDIETLGTTTDCAILSIAAVEFDRNTGDLGRQFYERLDPCLQNRRLCPATLKWWASQDSGLFGEAIGGSMDLPMVLVLLNHFVSKDHPVWSQGIDFDFGILDHAFNHFDIETPWKYYAKRDTRTLYDAAGFNPKTIKREGSHHNALDDCKHQIRCVVAAMGTMVKQ